jgi:hypothetical protein
MPDPNSDIIERFPLNGKEMTDRRAPSGGRRKKNWHLIL